MATPLSKTEIHRTVDTLIVLVSAARHTTGVDQQETFNVIFETLARLQGHLYDDISHELPHHE